MKSSPELLKFVESWEGERLSPYKDAGGHFTIGVGHLMADGESMSPITEEEALAILASDLNFAEKAVNSLVKVPLRQNQFDALVDFVFNCGANAFRGSKLLIYLNAGNYSAAADSMLNWNHIGNVVSAGLTRRRAAERILFINGVYGHN